ncbi:NAD-dependent epimerase/dehydratase family protein [Marinitoga lauensis]|uniref:NAD-dependent epimerase/dehydratase family protein n=1 Tax=Marinitoga lauensis TaxID=2201189 RepID=UPI00140455A3|nr:NAD-dependent epimerase/dehydratase family protein [Marinitoga lauensis]
MILITGATGHIGNVLVKKLYDQGEKIRIFVLPDEDISIFDGMNLDIIYGDIRDYNAVKNACKNVEKVFHLAAIISLLPWKDKLVYSVNIGGVENIIKAVKDNRVEKLLYVSSVHAFAEIEKGATIEEDTPINPKRTTGAYGKSKAIATLKILEAIRRKEINATIVFPTGIIGPYDYKNSEIFKVFKDYIDGKIKYCVDGAFDFVDVRNVVEGIIEASKKIMKSIF